MEKIQLAEVGFKSLTEHIDATTQAGWMLMQMVGSFAEFERAMIRECTRAGLETARTQGRIGERQPKLNDRQKNEIIERISSGRKTASEAARNFNL